MTTGTLTKWVIKEPQKDSINQLQKQLRIHPVICNLLIQRDIHTFDQAKKFFRPSLRELHDPFLMKDMDIAIQRINDAIYYKEKILVYGDYDVDGTTAVALLYIYLKKNYDNVMFYVPNRYKEGYGVSIEAIDWAKSQDISLIICLDCGIKAVDKIAYAKEQGVDFIIGDHHTPGDVLPPAVAVLDPKRKDCTYPYKELSGCGIGIVFVIGPKINAAGRMDDAMQAVKLLTAEENKRANDKATILNNYNTDRKQIDHDITQEAIDLIVDNAEQQAKKTTVLYKPYWHKGVIGIVASRLMQRFYRPTVILTLSNGMVTGSARSVKGFNVYNAIDSCSDLIEQFGGHKYAAGLTIKEDNVPEFISRFEKVVDETITDDQLIPEVSIDAAIRLRDVNEKFFNILQQMAPFGPANLKPVFIAEKLYDTGYSAIVGENHLKLNAKQNDSFVFKGIGYGLAERYEFIKDREPFDLCFTVGENVYRGVASLQLNIKDIKPSES